MLGQYRAIPTKVNDDYQCIRVNEDFHQCQPQRVENHPATQSALPSPLPDINDVSTSVQHLLDCRSMQRAGPASYEPAQHDGLTHQEYASHCSRIVEAAQAQLSSVQRVAMSACAALFARYRHPIAGEAASNYRVLLIKSARVPEQLTVAEKDYLDRWFTNEQAQTYALSLRCDELA